LLIGTVFEHLVLPFAERNLNPKAACLKRREEEKADEYSASHNVIAPSEPVLHSSVVCVTTNTVHFCLLLCVAVVIRQCDIF